MLIFATAVNAAKRVLVLLLVRFYCLLCISTFVVLVSRGVLCCAAELLASF